METIISQLIESINFGYVLAVNVLTYIIIKVIDELNGVKELTAWQKRITLIYCIVTIGTIYVLFGYNDYIKLVNSAIITPISWTWVLKPICVKLKIDYKK